MKSIILFFILISFCSCNNDEINELRNRISHLEEENLELQKLSDELQLEKEDLEESLEEQEYEIATLQSTLFEARNNANELKSSLFMKNDFLIKCNIENLINTLNNSILR